MGPMREKNMITPDSGEDGQPTAAFNNLIGKIGTEVSMALYKSRVVEAKECGYTVLPDFADTSNPDLFRDVKLLFDVAKDAALERRTQVDFSQDVFQTLKRKQPSETAGS